jgi:hypothetical protein
VELFNTSVLRRREEETAPISEGKIIMQDNSWFPWGGVTGGCNSEVVCDGDR